MMACGWCWWQLLATVWWAFLAMMMMGQNSLLAKCIVVAPQNRCRTNVTKTECECRQSLTHLLTRKNNVVQKKIFFDNLNLTSWTSWRTVQSSNLLGGKYILLAIFSSLLYKQLVQTKTLRWDNPIFCRFQYKTACSTTCPCTIHYSIPTSLFSFVQGSLIVSFAPRTYITPNNFLS